MRKYVVDYRFDNCGFLLDSIIYNYENVFNNLVEKYNYIDWLVSEAKYELENYGDSIMAERVENVLKWINQVEPKLAKRIQHENPLLFKILETEDDNIKSRNKLITEPERYIMNTKELKNIPINNLDEKSKLRRNQDEKLMAINESPIIEQKAVSSKKNINLIKCKIPRKIFINAIMKLAEEDEDWNLIRHKNYQDLESQIIMNFSFPDDTLSKKTSDKHRKIVWLKSLPLLHYFIVYLSNEKNKIFDIKPKQYIDMIETHFCDGLMGGKDYKRQKIQDSRRYKNNKGAYTNGIPGVPIGFELVNDFISFLKL